MKKTLFFFAVLFFSQGISAQVSLVTEQYSCGIKPAGAAYNAYNTRKMNTVSDTSLLSINGAGYILIKPAPGNRKFLITASAPASGVGVHQLVLRNIISNTIIQYGTSEWAPYVSGSAGSIVSRSTVTAVIDVPANTAYTLSLDHWLSVNQETGNCCPLGRAKGGAPCTEVYATATVQKLQ